MKELMTEFNRIIDVYVDIFKSRGKIDKVIKEVSDIKYIKNSYDYALLEGYNKMLETEELAKNLVDKAVNSHPMWDRFFKDVKGCGTATAGRLLAKLDPAKARYVANFWSYCGIDTRINEDGSVVAMSKKSTIEVEYVDKNGNVATKKLIRYDPQLQSVLLGILVPSIIKSGRGSKYWECYYNVKNHYTNRADLMNIYV